MALCLTQRPSVTDYASHHSDNNFTCASESRRSHNRVRTRRRRRVLPASFPVSSSSPQEAAYNRVVGSLSFKRTHASSTVVVPRKNAEGAGTVSGALSCSPSTNSGYDSASRDRAEVCSLSREVMFQPLACSRSSKPYGLLRFSPEPTKPSAARGHRS